jgi:membrane-bound lytic murein transglycosylase D
MNSRFWLPAAAFIGVAVLAAGCGGNLQTVRTTATAPGALSPASTVPTAVPPPPEDPVLALIAESQRHFTEGEQELGVGHLEQAKKAFDAAVDVLLQSPYGARSEPRIREHFDRLVERISAYDISALAQGDGFVEKRYAPASIDDLLALSTFEQPSPTIELRDFVASDLRLTSHDVDIPLNGKVLSYVELFETRLHDWFDQGLQRASRYLPMIQEVFKSEGVPLDLAYVPLIESAFNPNALSRAKAKGLWQFMGGTGRDYSLQQNWYIDERSDPEKATRAAASYLKTLGGMFDGDWHLALASYNGGPGRVQKAMTLSRKGDFWALSESARFLPHETREYVPMILAAIVIARNPSQYGFDVSPEQPLSYEKVTVDNPIDLRRVAEWTGAPIDDIQALNPELRRWTTPVRVPKYDLKVPVGTGDAFRARLTEVSPESLTALQWYTVKRGESLLSISRGLKVKQSDLAEANYLSVRDRVTPGQQLIIPRAPTTLLAARTDAPAPEPQMAISRTAVPAKASLQSSTSARLEPQKVVYRVKSGDTLFSIARLYNTTVASIKSWNARVINGNQIRVGDRLTILTTRGHTSTN